MKKFIIINGPMGVGKTKICTELNKKLNNSVWLDGDWCWCMNPWNISSANKNMVIDNIQHILNNFIKNNDFEYVIFSWVIHKPKIFEKILDQIQSKNYQLYKISLMCSEKELIKRMAKDKRSKDVIKKSLEKLPLYATMDTIKIDTSKKKPSIIVDEIMQVIEKKHIK